VGGVPAGALAAHRCPQPFSTDARTKVGGDRVKSKELWTIRPTSRREPHPADTRRGGPVVLEVLNNLVVHHGLGFIPRAILFKLNGILQNMCRIKDGTWTL
jgi:hypothetical protein